MTNETEVYTEQQKVRPCNGSRWSGDQYQWATERWRAATGVIFNASLIFCSFAHLCKGKKLHFFSCFLLQSSSWFASVFLMDSLLFVTEQSGNPSAIVSWLISGDNGEYFSASNVASGYPDQNFPSGHCLWMQISFFYSVFFKKANKKLNHHQTIGCGTKNLVISLQILPYKG